MSNENMNRRGFVAALSLAGLGITGCIFGSKKQKAPEPKAATAAPEKKPAASGSELISESDPTAVALKYKHDKSNVDAAITKGRKDYASEFCNTCIHYVAQGESQGKCNLFGNKGLVAAKGWCASFVKKA